MNLTSQIQKIIDQLIYNKAYAPDYPSEDHTNMGREETRIRLWLDEALTSIRREDIGDWVRLSRSCVDGAFTKLRKGDRDGSVREFQFAVQYLRNATARKPHKVDFVVKKGEIIITPSHSSEESEEHGK